MLVQKSDCINSGIFKSIFQDNILSLHSVRKWVTLAGNNNIEKGSASGDRAVSLKRFICNFRQLNQLDRTNGDSGRSTSVLSFTVRSLLTE